MSFPHVGMAKRFGARFSLQDGRHRAAGGDGIQALDRSHHVLEASVNTWAVADLLRQHAGRVVVSNPLRTRAIASAKVKTDKVDSEVLAQLLAADFIPEVWVPDDATRQLRHLVSRAARWCSSRPGNATASTPSCTATSSTVRRQTSSGWRAQVARRGSTARQRTARGRQQPPRAGGVGGRGPKR